MKVRAGGFQGGGSVRGSAQPQRPLAGFFWYFSCRDKNSTYPRHIRRNKKGGVTAALPVM